MQEDVEDKYIEPLVDKLTNLLTDDIPTIMNYLAHVYVKFQSEEASKKKSDVMSLTCQPS